MHDHPIMGCWHPGPASTWHEEHLASARETAAVGCLHHTHPQRAYSVRMSHSMCNFFCSVLRLPSYRCMSSSRNQQTKQPTATLICQESPNELYHLFLNFIISLCLCVCYVPERACRWGEGQVCHGMSVEAWGQLCGVSFFLPPLHGFWGSKSGHQACAVEPSYQPHKYTFFYFFVCLFWLHLLCYLK